MVKGTFVFTLSKLMGYLIFIVGTVYAFIFKDSMVLISMTGIGAGLLGLKSWNETIIAKNNITNTTQPIEQPDMNPDV